MYEFDVGTLSTYHDMEWTSKEGPDRKKKRRKRNDMNFHAQSHVPHLFGPYQRLESRPGRQIDLHVANVANLFHLLRSVLSGTAFVMDICFCVAHFVFILGIQQLR
jgi:glutathione S-transferase